MLDLILFFLFLFLYSFYHVWFLEVFECWYDSFHSRRFWSWTCGVFFAGKAQFFGKDNFLHFSYELLFFSCHRNIIGVRNFSKYSHWSSVYLIFHSCLICTQLENIICRFLNSYSKFGLQMNNVSTFTWYFFLIREQRNQIFKMSAFPNIW